MERKEHFSRKRAAILEALQGTKCHPTADWVYQRLKPQYPDLSLGTVYRNLNRFCETGQAISLGVIDGYEHFDGDTSPHAHLVCRQCGSVVDIFEVPFEKELFEVVSQRADCQVESASITLQGLCPACVKKGKTA